MPLTIYAYAAFTNTRKPSNSYHVNFEILCHSSVQWDVVDDGLLDPHSFICYYDKMCADRVFEMAGISWALHKPNIRFDGKLLWHNNDAGHRLRRFGSILVLEMSFLMRTQSTALRVFLAADVTFEWLFAGMNSGKSIKLLRNFDKLVNCQEPLRSPNMFHQIILYGEVFLAYVAFVRLFTCKSFRFIVWMVFVVGPLGTIPVWMRLCWVSVFDWLKDLSQISHW